MGKKTRRLRVLNGGRKKTRTKRGGQCEEKDKTITKLEKIKKHNREKIKRYEDKLLELGDYQDKYNDLMKKCQYEDEDDDDDDDDDEKKSVVGKTKHFELREGESFGGLVDIYLSEIDSYAFLSTTESSESERLLILIFLNIEFKIKTLFDSLLEPEILILETGDKSDGVISTFFILIFH